MAVTFSPQIEADEFSIQASVLHTPVTTGLDSIRARSAGKQARGERNYQCRFNNNSHIDVHDRSVFVAIMLFNHQSGREVVFGPSFERLRSLTRLLKPQFGLLLWSVVGLIAGGIIGGILAPILQGPGLWLILFGISLLTAAWHRIAGVSFGWLCLFFIGQIAATAILRYVFGPLSDMGIGVVSGAVMGIGTGWSLWTRYYRLPSMFRIRLGAAKRE